MADDTGQHEGSPAAVGWVGVRSCTWGPIWTSSPMVMGATSSAISPKLANTPAPILIW